MDEKKQANRQSRMQRNVKQIKNKKFQEVIPWKSQEVCLVENFEQCRALTLKLRSHCINYNVLGIDCDWIKYSKQKIALLLLSTHDGLCALIRLSTLQRVPTELKEILEDENILKVTVDPVDVAKKLTDYGVCVESVFDLRYLAKKCNSKELSLMELSTEHLKVKLNEDYRLERSRWKRNNFSESDVNYAAKCVRVSIELFKLFEEKLKDPSSNNDVQKFIDEHCKQYLNKYYRSENLIKNGMPANANGAENEILLPKPSIRVIATAETCDVVVQQIREHCDEYRALGFCCKYKASQSTDLLQLMTHHGLCAFIQLSKLKTIPDELKQLLEDESIIKVGGTVFADADRLQRDYDVCVANTIDLRHLAKECNYRSVNLDRLSKEILNVDLSADDWRLLSPNWKADNFSDAVLNYTAKKVQVLIELFKIFEEKLVEDKYSGDRTKFIEGICQEYSNEDFPKRKAKNTVQEEAVELSEQNIQVVSTADECKAIVQQLLSDCNEYNVLGFDCEWIPLGRRKVAMLQLASHRGLCALFRLCKLEKIPNEFHEILRDEKILKVGISPLQDAKKLEKDYCLKVKGTLDLARLAKKCKYKSKGLGKLAEEVLNVKLPFKKKGLIVDKMHRQWEKEELNDGNIKYAANDVHISIELFKKFQEKLTIENPASNDSQTKKLQDFIDQHCTPHIK